MTESLFSASWYRVAELRPRLRSHALIHRHLYRGQLWYVLQDRSSGRFHRFSPTANMVIGLMDGKRTLREIWELACGRLGDDAPTQEEVIGMLSALHRADVLQTDIRPDMPELHQRNVRQERMKLKQYIQNPLSLRIPLFDPDRLLNWMNPLGRWMFGPVGAVLWLGLMAWAAVVAGQHWGELAKDMSDQLFAAENLLLIALVFPFAKMVHEFGHAMALKARGGEVHEMGLMLLVLMPVPYLDASASLAFREKRDRMLVGAAGMLTELALAALALFVWVAVEPGVIRAVAYNVMLVAGVSTLIFNANPLLRFDGYYIFSDLLEIPNLGQRANAHIAFLLKRYLLGVKRALAGNDVPGERTWFVGFAVASFCYRMFITFTIALMVAQQFFVLGIVLAVWSLYNALVLPLTKPLGYLFSSLDLRGRRLRAFATTALVLVVVAAVVLLVPVPSWTRTEGVTVAAQDTGVRATADGFVSALGAQPGQRVKRGETLFTTEDPDLVARVAILAAQVNEQIARYQAAHNEPLQMKIIGDELAHLRARLAEARKRVAELVIRSPVDGVFVLSDAADAVGHFVRRGELLGYVMDRSAITVQVVVPQGDIDLVRQMTRRIELRLVESIPEVLLARVKRVVPAATNQLPGRALSTQGGGELAPDPDPANTLGREAQARAATTLFVLELELDPVHAVPMKNVGSRVYARFEREPEPLGTQLYRVVRRTLLSLFNV